MSYYSDSMSFRMHTPSISSLSSRTSLSSFSNQPIIQQVRALYDFEQVNKACSLKFKKGDIIKVIVKLESGWWDGVNSKGERGWFPSNYVEPYSEFTALEEVSLEFQKDMKDFSKFNKLSAYVQTMFNDLGINTGSVVSLDSHDKEVVKYHRLVVSALSKLSIMVANGNNVQAIKELANLQSYIKLLYLSFEPSTVILDSFTPIKTDDQLIKTMESQRQMIGHIITSNDKLLIVKNVLNILESITPADHNAMVLYEYMNLKEMLYEQYFDDNISNCVLILNNIVGKLKLLIDKKDELKLLIDKLVNENDEAFNKCFLLVYKSFMTSKELFKELQNSYESTFNPTVIDLLLEWLSHYWFDKNNQKETKVLLANMLGFAENHKLRELIMTVEPLLSRSNQLSEVNDYNFPLVNMKRLKLLGMKEGDLAKQLTVREYKYFRKVDPSELLVSARSPTLNEFINNAKELSNFVSFTILNQANHKKRAAQIVYFINVAHNLLMLHNYSSMMSILTALLAQPVKRLKKTWAYVPHKSHDLLNTLQAAQLELPVHLPGVPFLGPYLSELQSFHTLRNKLTFTNLHYKISKLLNMFVGAVPYGTPFSEIPQAQEQISEGFASASPIDTHYELSLILEPREKANQRMQQLLLETGYL